jgi:hypothetical protein
MKLTRFCNPLVLLLLALLVGCKPAKDISGAWFGTLNAGHIQLRLVLHIKPDGNSYKATIDTLDQGRADLPISGVRVKGADVHVELGAFGAVYDAKVNPTGTEMTGFFRQAGMNIPFTMKKTAQPPKVAPPLLPASYTPRTGSDLQGYWQGAVAVGNVQTRIGFKISEPSKGKFRAELDSVDQGATGIPITALNYQAPNLHMEAAGVAGVFDGTLTRSGEITGTWKQGPNNLPVTLKKGTALPTELANYKYVGETTPQGVWKGSLDAKTAVLRIVLKIGKLPDGGWVAKLDSPDQGSSDIPASSVLFTPPSHVSVEWKAINCSFAGEFKDNKLNGSWAQAGRTLPLTLQRDTSAK